MKRTKIAPTLVRCLPAWIERTQGTKSHDAASAELRALIAVARAADAEEVWQMTREEREDETLLPPWRRLRDALARLDRVSRG